jgi:predicted nucleotidyltransferase
MSRQIDWQDTAALWKDISKITAVWLFGSAQAGEVSEGSDVDIAVLTEQPLSFVEQLEILSRLRRQLQFDEIDLVVLNEANPILRFEAVSGKLLFCRDRQQMAAFVSLVAREYEDEMAQWRMALQARNPYSASHEP